MMNLLLVSFALLFLGGLCWGVATGHLAPPIVALYAVASLLTAIVYGWDKARARRRGWRIPEATLHLLGLLGGWPGALLAQRLFRHKTAKTSFQVFFWLTVLAHLLMWGWVLQP
jgi:uncharacterized membrane protein YsdA (DUF1294 family)